MGSDQSNVAPELSRLSSRLESSTEIPAVPAVWVGRDGSAEFHLGDSFDPPSSTAIVRSHIQTVSMMSMGPSHFHTLS